VPATAFCCQDARPTDKKNAAGIAGGSEPDKQFSDLFLLDAGLGLGFCLIGAASAFPFLRTILLGHHHLIITIF
jgi:hypothetical protein